MGTMLKMKLSRGLRLSLHVKAILVGTVFLLPLVAAAQRSTTPSKPKEPACKLMSDANGSYCANKGCKGTCEPEYSGSGASRKVTGCKDCSENGCEYKVTTKEDGTNEASCTPPSGGCTLSVGGSILPSFKVSGFKVSAKAPEGKCELIDVERADKGETGCACKRK